jgi:hypothetical protein
MTSIAEDLPVGLRNLHVDELPSRSDAVVDENPAVDLGSHPLMTALEQVLRFLTNPFEKNLHPASHERLSPRQRYWLLARQKGLVALPRLSARNPVGQLCRRRSLLGAIYEGSQVVELRLVDEIQQVLKVRL